MAAIDQIDFKQTKQKFFDKPLYCRAMRNLTPIKESTGTKENQKKEEITEEKENGEAEKK